LETSSLLVALDLNLRDKDGESQSALKIAKSFDLPIQRFVKMPVYLLT